MKDYKLQAVIVIVFLLVSVAFSACAATNHNDQVSEDPNISTKIPNDSNASVPAFFHDLGKTFSEVKNEHTEGEFIIRPDGFPDYAAVCFGSVEAEYLYYFFGAQSGDAEKVMSECEEQLKCAGFLTTVNVLFPEMDEDMSFEEFFSLIDVEDYEYFGEDTITAAGWLRFTYNGMEVMVNTNELTTGGGWYVTGIEIVKINAPVSIADPELLDANDDLAKSVMFD